MLADDMKPNAIAAKHRARLAATADDLTLHAFSLTAGEALMIDEAMTYFLKNRLYRQEAEARDLRRRIQAVGT